MWSTSLGAHSRIKGYQAILIELPVMRLGQGLIESIVEKVTDFGDDRLNFKEEVTYDKSMILPESGTYVIL